MNNANSVATISFNSFISADVVKKKIDEVIGGEKGQRFITAIVSAVNNNEALKDCANTSIFSAALLGESLNLSPSPQLGQYYMVPFNDKEKGKVAQFQLGYKGYIQLAIRSGQYKDIDVIEIREGEFLGRNSLNGKYQFKFIEDEDVRESKPIIGYMAYFEYMNGFSKQLYWSKEKMIKHADKYAPAFNMNEIVNKSEPKKCRVSYQDFVDGKYPKQDGWKYSSFWYKDFDQMAFKTLLRQLISKWGIMSIDMQTAFENDQAIIHDDGTKEYPKKEEDHIPEAKIVDDDIKIEPVVGTMTEAEKTTERQITLDELQNN